MIKLWYIKKNSIIYISIIYSLNLIELDKLLSLIIKFDIEWKSYCFITKIIIK